MEDATVKPDYFVQGRIWIDSDKGPFLGFGRVQLLKKIREYGSISQAAKSMGMSYRQAWQLIESMNMKACHPLVIKSTGGKGGGGATVTEVGEKMIGVYEALDVAFLEFIEMKSKEMKF
ncbi:MAG TPA: LysR family transcriptional regulator [Cytophagaceae bacterium]|jgi:molybdate transport system regulatory protein|nr:LysR family transcriptional regulator [Cytophagaceae bacterium]